MDETMTAANPSVRLERTIAATPHQVYRAWLQPDLLRRWLAPGDLEVTRADVDEHVGGHFRIWQEASGSDAGGFDGELIELVPDQRLVFRWGFVGPDRENGPTFDSVLTITLADAPGGSTALTLVHERLDELRTAMPEVAEQVETGWALVLAKLATTVASPSS
jgi:uncharacterized protein YndB with AHSA1/START domain